MKFTRFRASIQEAALDPALWPEVLHRLSEEASSIGSILISSSHKLPFAPVSPSIVPLLDVYYGQEWNKSDIRFKGLDYALRTGAVTDQDILDEREIAKAPFYQDLLRPFDCRWFCAIPFTVAQEHWFLSVQRTVRQGPFEPDEVERLKALVKPLAAAGRISHAVSYSRILGVTDAFQRLSQPAFILDEQGHLIALNAMAERRLAGILDFQNRAPKFRFQHHQAQFDRILSMAHLNGAYEDGLGGQRMRISTPEDLCITVDRLDGWAHYTFSQARFLVTIQLSVIEDGRIDERLRMRYRLTKAETRLAIILASGSGVREASEQLEVSYETARTHLRNIFSKMGIDRQTKLAAIVARMSQHPLRR